MHQYIYIWGEHEQHLSENVKLQVRGLAKEAQDLDRHLTKWRSNSQVPGHDEFRNSLPFCLGNLPGMVNYEEIHPIAIRWLTWPLSMVNVCGGVGCWKVKIQEEEVEFLGCIRGGERNKFPYPDITVEVDTKETKLIIRIGPTYDWPRIPFYC